MKKLLIGCLLVGFTANVVHAQQKAPNVLFIAIDDLNDYVSLLHNYPGVKTPNLEQFAKTATLFSKAYCAAPVCNPSRAALLSGLAPYHTGVYDNDNDIKASKTILDAAFLPEHFKANGYVTITRGKIFHTELEKQRRAAMWDADGGKGNYGPNTKETNLPPDLRAPRMFKSIPWTGPETDHPDNITAGYIAAKLDSTYDKPFFMTCGLYKPHNPWTAPKRFFDMYPLESIQLPKVLDGDWDDLPPIAREWANNPVDFEALKRSGKWKEIVQGYLACMSFMDYNLGRVLDALNKSRYKENTIVILFGDNGFHLGEKKHFAKYALWEQTTHIIYMWRVPGLTKSGAICDKPVNLLSIYPTLVELCKLGNPSQTLDGKSIASLLKDPGAKWNDAAITTYKEGNQAIRDERYRYIHYSDDTEELYDETKDPMEWHNIAKEPAMKPLILSFRKRLQKESAPAVGSGKTEE